MDDSIKIVCKQDMEDSRDCESQDNTIIMKYLDLMDEPQENDNFGLVAEQYEFSGGFWDRMLEFQEKNVVSCWEVCTSDEFVVGLSTDDINKLKLFQQNMADLFEVSFEPLPFRINAILKIVKTNVTISKDLNNVTTFLLNRIPLEYIYDFIDEHLKTEMRENRLVQTV